MTKPINRRAVAMPPRQKHGPNSPAHILRGLRLSLLCLPLLLAACTGGPEVSQGPGADAEAGGRTLLLAASNGPIPLLVDQLPSTQDAVVTTDDLTDWAENGVSAWTNASFRSETSVGTGVRLIFRFTSLAAFAPNDACRDPTGGPVGAISQPPALFAYLCDGNRAVSSTTGSATGNDREALQRLVEAATARLVPSGSSARGTSPGVGLFGGVGLGSGGWSSGGVGIGLGF